MPLNAKGEKIKGAMEKEYGKKKGDSVFYASEKSGRVAGVTKTHKAANTYRGHEKHGNRK